MKFNMGVPPLSSAKFNPVKGLKEDTDFVIYLLVQIVGEDVAESVRSKAREVAIEQANTNPEVTMLDLVDAFDQVPELQNFSAALRKATLPAPFGKYFSEDVSDKKIAAY